MRGSAADRLLRLCVRIPPGAWKSGSFKCYVLLGRGICDEPIIGPEESYRQWCVVMCYPETGLGRSASKTYVIANIVNYAEMDGNFGDKSSQ